MRLHQLTLRAVGPYAGEFSVDFDRLGSSGLFLLEGPTGSGKSSIIDAVVFALYGKVAGADASDDRMHSDFAEPSVEPFVELDFSTSAGLFRVRRTPKYERPKQRGTGTTTQNATAKLWRLTSPDAEPTEPLTTRIEETAAALLDAIGLSRDQFVQTVVLPQGEFASFLRAPAETRRAVLQRLFGTEVYDRVVRQLEELRRKAQEGRREADVRVREAVAAFGGAAGLVAEQVAELTAHVDDDEALPAACHLVVDALELESARAVDARSTARAGAQQEALKLQQAREREELRQRRVALVHRHDELMAGQADQQARGDRLALAERAERARGVLDGLRASERRLALAEHELAEARQLLPDELVDESTQRWADEQRARRDEAAALAHLVALEESLAEVHAELVSADAVVAALQSARVTTDESLVLLPTEVDQLRRQRDAALGRAVGAAAAEQALATATSRLEAAQRAEQLTRQLTAARADAERVAGQAQFAQQREHELRQRYIEGMAGVLAVGLIPQQPCPVCGSLEHPQPAHRAPDDVDASDVEAAEQVCREALVSAETASAAVGQLNAAMAAATAESAGVVLADAQTAVTVAELSVADAQVARDDVERLDLQIGEAEGRVDALTQESSRLAGEASSAAAKATALRTTVQNTQVKLDTARTGYSTVAERVAARLAEADGLAAAEAVARDVQAVNDERGSWQANLVLACEENGFADASAVEAAFSTAEQRAEWVSEIAAFDSELAGVTAGLADPLLVATEDTVEVDLVPLVEAERVTAERAREAEAEAAAVEQRLTGATSSLATLTAAIEERALGFAQTAVVIRTANLMAAATSDNARAMTLPTYVLLERFKSVVAAANDRLAVMSDGRYSLEHVEERDSGRRSGLGLVVRDTHTEQSRDPRTLSGGETFYCSLALALGLADVVTAEAGGIDLGTLFVDEGFGTLDPDTLEQVLAVLGGLRAGGRVVGIVSHVPELKERISEQLVVRRNPDGSSRLDVVA